MKKQMRAWARSILGNLGVSCDASDIISEMPEFRAAKTVFTYVSCGAEPRTDGIIRLSLSLGKTLAVPRCIASGIMEAVIIKSEDALTCGKYGIPEPQKGEVLPFSKIDFAVIPCLCADRSANRLGHGGGYYDRFLSDFGGFSLLLCRKELEAEEIPLEEHDRPANKVIFI